VAELDIECSRRLGVALSFYGPKPHSQRWVTIAAMFAIVVLGLVFAKAGIDLLTI
jgi:hypothetical protein